MKHLGILISLLIFSRVLLAQVAVAPTQGDGSEANPYQIASLENLYWLSTTKSVWDKKYFIQTADIDASSTANWTTQWEGIGRNGQSFVGTYDGQGFSIIGFNINSTLGDDLGLFGFASNSVIKNISLVNVKILGNSYIGGLIGFDVLCAVSNCSVSGVVSGQSSVGGLIGFSRGEISNCYSRANVIKLTDKSICGGLLGFTDNKITNCYSAAKISKTLKTGGLFGEYWFGVDKNCFWDTVASSYGQACGILHGSVNAQGKTTAEMKTQTTFTDAGWDFVGESTNGSADIWVIDPLVNDGYPCFTWQRTLASVSTKYASQEEATSATFNGAIAAFSTNSVQSYGFCWSKTNKLPTVSDSNNDLGKPSAIGAFSSTIDTLTPNSTYYVRAYIKTSDGVKYGVAMICKTISLPGQVSTSAVSNINSTTALFNGEIISLGMPTSSYYGFCYSASNVLPNFSNEKIQLLKNTIGTINYNAFNLIPATKYYVRAFIISETDTVFGSVQSFTTTYTAPTVVTNAPTAINATDATFNGKIIPLGDIKPCNYGFCYSASNATPSIADSKTSENSTYQEVSFAMPTTGLTANTTYYVRAYASNRAGTFYGAVQQFTTAKQLPTVSSVTVSNQLSTSVNVSATITNLGQPAATSWGFCWSTTTSINFDNSVEQSTVSGIGVFSATLPYLTPNTTYYVWAYAKIGNTVVATSSYISFTSYVINPIAPALGNGSEKNPYQIATLENLYWLSQNYNKTQSAICCIQTADIDATSTAGWPNGGWTPIGRGYSNYFNGYYDGRQHIINGLTINRPNADYQGLFGSLAKSIVSNLGLTNVSIVGNSYVGGLYGSGGYSISNCFVTGKVSGNAYVGGLGGSSGGINNCYAIVNVERTSGKATSIGGLLGSHWDVKNSYSAGYVTGNSVGGFVGDNSGTYYIIENSCFWDTEASTRSQGYATNTGTFNAQGKTTAEMKTQATFTAAGWDFVGETTNGSDDIWAIDPLVNNGYPCFAWQVASAMVSTQAVSLITAESATANGTISQLGKTAVTAHGFCYSTSNATPTIADSKVDLGATANLGAFTASITKLTAATTYYVRAFATNAAGTVYGDVVTVQTNATAQPSQTLTLLKGWNLISINLQPQYSSIDSVFKDIKTKLISVKTTNHYYLTANNAAFNTLDTVAIGTAYWVQMSEATSVSISGQAQNVINTATLESGWNLVGFNITENTTLEAAFGMQLSKITAIKDDNSAWTKGSNTADFQIVPGKGYLVKFE